MILEIDRHNMTRSKAAQKSDDSATTDANQAPQVKMSEKEFSSMLLYALRHDEEVKSSVLMILRSRETDVYSAVVKCLRQGYDDVMTPIGMIYFLQSCFTIIL